MGSRDKASGKAGSAQRKTVALKRRNAPKAARGRNSLAAATETNVAVLTRERDEALEQQRATSEVLRAISNAPTDAASTLGAIAESVARLLDVTDAEILMRVEGNLLRSVAKYGPSRNWPLGTTPTLSRDWVTGRAVIDRTAIHVADLQASDCEFSQGAAFARQYGHRTTLAVPLLREGSAIGAILIRRMEVKPFTDRQIELVSSFASQAVIAIENARLLNELSESLRRQTATADVLKVISRSTFDLSAVLNTLVESAARLCEADMASVPRLTGTIFDQVASYGYSPDFHEFMRRNPILPGRGTAAGRAVAEGKTIHIPDVLADPEYDYAGGQKVGGFRTLLGVPLMREGAAIGALVLGRSISRPFTPEQIELVETFADQAVIAIENTRLFEQVQAKTRDLTESLEQQTATSEVLKVISRSSFNLEPVLETLVESAAKLCQSDKGFINLRDGDLYRYAVNYGFSSEFVEYAKQNPMSPGRGTITGRAIFEGKTIHIPDVLADLEYAGFGFQARGHYRSSLGVPLLRGGEAIGVFALTRSDVRPFTDKQIELVSTFADQAVIAIENARLFEEVKARTEDLRESLQQQTATADVLKVISRSTFDLQPVLDTLVSSACRLCEADIGTIRYQDGSTYRLAAEYGCTPEWHDHLARQSPKPDRGSIFGRTIVEGGTIHIPDVLADPEFTRLEAQKLMGFRAALGVPLIREGQVFGVLSLLRFGPRSFTKKQIELVETFADQAVIAIGNVRLFDEVQAKTRGLTEALVYQTGSSNILKVIASSPTDVDPALKAIVDSACEICDANDAVVLLKEGDDLVLSAHHGPIPFGWERWPINRRWVTGRAVVDKVTQHFRDVLGPEGDDLPEAREIVRQQAHRTVLSVPLLQEGAAIGAIVLRRVEVQPFSEKQIELLKSFADQAVIAISNVRLFDQVQARTRELSQSLEDLRTAQDRLIQTEKLASLGQLTAGIAHEIKNPLNFVNNFSELSAELTDELNDALKPVAMDGKVREEVDELTGMLKDNLEKVVQHGKRADSIVKNMLLHSREGSREHRPADINSLLDESLNLAYHGARAEKGEFNITLRRDFDADAGTIELFPQEVTRAFLNLIANGVYAATKRKTEDKEPGFEPTLRATTKNLGTTVEIRIRDNGTGIPAEVKEKMFNPFFTTKPAGEGTGLGLSMTHDIIVKQHGGRIDVTTEPGKFTEFTIVLPRNLSGGDRGET